WHEFCKQKGDSGDSTEKRMEFRSPGADARHDLAVLMVMAAIYQGLKGRPGQLLLFHDDRSFKLDCPKTVQESIQRFESSSQLMADLEAITHNDKHVAKLKKAILRAAHKQTLHQPSLAEQEEVMGR